MSNKPSIYDQHNKAFHGAGAWVVLLQGEVVAKVSIKYPKDGASRLWAYVHWLGVPMVRGYADGFGYDKSGAAVSSASRLLADLNEFSNLTSDQQDSYVEFVKAMVNDTGEYWQNRLSKAGFQVIQAL